MVLQERLDNWTFDNKDSAKAIWEGELGMGQTGPGLRT
jgi:hypothetical protein